MIASDCSLHILVVYRGMVSPAVFLVSHVGKHVVLRLHILALKVGPFIFLSPTLVISQCTTSLPSMWLPCIFSSAAFRCKSRYFPEYLKPKQSTTKVKFNGRLLFFHCPGFLIEGWYPYGSRCFIRESCATRPACGSP